MDRGTAFLVDPKSPLEFATAIRTMPQARAQAMTRLWMTPERRHDWNRQALEYDHRRAEGSNDPGEKTDEAVQGVLVP